ncbi:MAG: zinc ribbon domain-containing protein [Deltaproteobacteria bacterium]|nr:zinc ribbon domain-containing protein [Deltaproteobacteria bacterium]
MALIKCSECGKEISDKAEKCVHCGCPVELTKAKCPNCGFERSPEDQECPKCGIIYSKFETVAAKKRTAEQIPPKQSTLAEQTPPKQSMLTKRINIDKYVLPIVGVLTCAWILIYVFSDPAIDKTDKHQANITPVQNISDEIKESAIYEIKRNPMVKDAAIVQDGKDIRLAIIVGYATSERKAKELGDGFMRLVKGLSGDKFPGKEIGTGEYDYMIGVYYPDKKRVALGAKVRSSPHITW